MCAIRDGDLLTLACIELAVANWDAEDHPNPIRGQAPFGWVRNAVMLRGPGGTYASQSAKLSASLRRLAGAGLVQRSADGWFDITPAGDQRLADDAYELPAPRCGACGSPDGREDLNDVATPSSGMAAGSPATRSAWRVWRRGCANPWRFTAGARPAAPSHAPTEGAPLNLADHVEEDHIESWAVPADNALRFRHIGCDGATSTYTHPLDDVPLPLTGATEECAHCCHIRPLRRRESPVEQFTLDRQALADHLTAEGLHQNDGRPPGLLMLDCSPAAAAASLFSHAIDAGAIGGPGDLEAVVYEQDGDALLIAVREKDPWIKVRVPERQIGRWALEAKHLCGYRDTRRSCWSSSSAPKPSSPRRTPPTRAGTRRR